MWFNPAELLENKTVPLATFATPATFEEKSSKTAVESRKVAGVANTLPEKTVIPISKLAEPDNQKFVNCGKCLNFNCHNSHGKGAGICTIGGDYGQWSETPHQCTKFDAAVEWVFYDDIVKPGALMVTCFSPNWSSVRDQGNQRRTRGFSAKNESQKVKLWRINTP